ncbi:general substrate transporter, partial [Thozetella sp. PMI_491]
ILISSAITGVGIVLQTAAQNIVMFVVARIIIGFGIQISNTAVPTLLAELLPLCQRSRVLGIFFSYYYVGSLLSSIINFDSQDIPTTWAWRLPSLLQFIPSLLAVALLPYVPESPLWFLHVGREDEARE